MLIPVIAVRADLHVNSRQESAAVDHVNSRQTCAVSSLTNMRELNARKTFDLLNSAQYTLAIAAIERGEFERQIRKCMTMTTT